MSERTAAEEQHAVIVCYPAREKGRIGAMVVENRERISSHAGVSSSHAE
jgi:hypothetical protein